jgi:hypothetical protein
MADTGMYWTTRWKCAKRGYIRVQVFNLSRKVIWSDVKWIHLTKDWFMKRLLVDAIVNFWFPETLGVSCSSAWLFASCLAAWLFASCLAAWLFASCLAAWLFASCLAAWLFASCLAAWLIASCLAAWLFASCFLDLSRYIKNFLLRSFAITRSVH